jgi:hypothetical protein
LGCTIKVGCIQDAKRLRAEELITVWKEAREGLTKEVLSQRSRNSLGRFCRERLSVKRP